MSDMTMNNLKIYEDDRIRFANAVRQPAKDDRSAGIGKQVLRSGTSIGAHYREGYIAQSPMPTS
jgi:four helix bundle protein